MKSKEIDDGIVFCIIAICIILIITIVMQDYCPKNVVLGTGAIILLIIGYKISNKRVNQNGKEENITKKNKRQTKRT